MNTEKTRVVETVYTQKQERVESLGEGLRVMADVTTQNGEVTAIDGITVTDPGTEETLWSGGASPNVSGTFYTQGREIETLTAVMEFIEAVRN